jgi:cysteinyl-tRNA synthetase
MMQAHYRSTLDLSSDSLNAAEKGYTRLSDALQLLPTITTSETSSVDVAALVASFYKAMNDDFNAPMLVAALFEGVKYINALAENKATISAADLAVLTSEYQSFIGDVLGLHVEKATSDAALNATMDLVLAMRKKAREEKDWTTSDQIRDKLQAAGIVIKDGKDGASWTVK